MLQILIAKTCLLSYNYCMTIERRVLFINGSSRGQKGLTYRLSTIVAKEFTEMQYTVNYLNLVDYNIGWCKGCVSEDARLCNPSECVKGELDDDFRDIMHNHLLKYDVMVFLSPVYWYSPPAVLKNLIERMTSLENANKMLDGKIGGFVVTAQEDGAMMTILSLMGSLNDMGFMFPPYAFTYSVGYEDPLKDSEAVLYAKRLARNLVKLHSLVKRSEWR